MQILQYKTDQYKTDQYKTDQNRLTAQCTLLAGRDTLTSMPDKLKLWIKHTIAPTAAMIWRQVRIWQQRARQRRALSQLSHYELKDIGVTRYDAIHEANKPFWKS